MMDLKLCFFIKQHLTRELKKGKGTEYILSWKSKGVYNSKVKPYIVLSYIAKKLSR